MAVEPGERVALVGPSGAGKTLTARLACLPPPADLRLEGTVAVDGRTGLLAQESATALDPGTTVGHQLGLVARTRASDRGAARRAVAAVLDELGLDPAVARRHPTVLSGGQRQRVALALALLAEPELLVADEPTSALDPVTAAEVVATVRRALDSRRTALLLVTHDPAVAAGLCERVVRLADGQVHDGLGPEVGHEGMQAPHVPRVPGEPVLTWSAVSRTWRAPARGGGRGRSTTVGVRDLSLEVRSGEHVAVLGASGAGKSTLVRLAAGRDRPTVGSVRVVARAGRAPALQSVPQDAGGSLTPWRTVRQLLVEALRVDHPDATDLEEARLADLLGVVHLGADLLDRRPATLSGGQRQRVAIARALAAGPRVLLGDEMLSALDAPTRGAVADAVRAHADAAGATLVVCTHDLDVAARLAARIVVLGDGRIVDDGPVALLGAYDAGSPALRALREASGHRVGALR
nr:ATP-binding cassette domain-containing protein [Nocardioides zeae]